MSFPSNLSTNTDQWIALQEYVYNQIHYPNYQWLDKVIWVLVFSHLLTMVLYAISGLKRARVSGWAPFVKDAEGYIHPQMYSAVSFGTLLHGIVACLSMLCFLSDLQSQPRLYTIVFQLIAISNMRLNLRVFSMEVMVVAYALPPSKFTLNQRINASILSGRLKKHVLGRNQFNYIEILGLALPFLLPAIPAVLSLKSLSVCLSQWKNFDRGCSDVIRSFNSSSTAENLSVGETALLRQEEVLSILRTLGQESEKSWFYIRCTAGIYCGLLCLQLLTSSWLNICILRKLFSQVKVFRDCYRRRMSLKAKSIASTSDASFPDVIKGREASQQFNIQFPNSLDSDAQSSILSLHSWSHWLPSVKPGTEVSSEMWRTSLFSEDEKCWQDKDDLAMRRRYSRLRAYVTNTLWAMIFVFVVASSVISLTALIASNWFHAPHGMSVAQAWVWIFLWTNLIWG
ncbi:hypothetical protein CROQUDRAFT_36149 [Cronartium quercuum f. sp. fusiforme G11]|uniref:Uncharacterized protein n=1 Tax=Cronartium quercuum f. sp. fusiforme G11 TaxID=708437 RepID=A0A9P6NYL6_9BASI|nr:hypothetical protein CROQUDRAFT_36149 [Cronartium quercuum f. sp. fusiforme G11]